MSVGGSFMFNLKHNLLRSRFEGKGLLYVQFKKRQKPKNDPHLEARLVNYDVLCLKTLFMSYS